MFFRYKRKYKELEKVVLALQNELKLKEGQLGSMMISNRQMVKNIQELNSDKDQLINQLYEKANVNPEDILNNRFDTDSGMYQISGPGEK